METHIKELTIINEMALTVGLVMLTTVEVFDVIITTKQRLQLFNLTHGCDVYGRRRGAV